MDIKELRYSVEFLAPLCRPKRARNYASSLEAMQDCLGLMHDGMISRQMVAEYGLGHQVECEPKARARQLKKLDARFKHLKKAGPYWR